MNNLFIGGDAPDRPKKPVNEEPAPARTKQKPKKK